MAFSQKMSIRTLIRPWHSLPKVFSRNCHVFGSISITDDLWQRIKDKSISTPTEIQEKALKSINEGKNVVINSETGSGKTLCYLLPIIMNLQKSRKYFQSNLISSSRALIFAPTKELLHQIGCVCKDLGINDVNVAHDGKPLCIDETTQFILTTPKYLMNFDWQRIKNIKHIVFDEADLMFVSQFKEVRKLFEFYTGRKIDFSRKEAIRRKKRESKRNYTFSQYGEAPQFIFAGATMPGGGRKTVLSLIERFVPDSQLVQTEMVHMMVQNTKFDFIEIDDDFDIKTFVLGAILERELLSSNCHLSNAFLQQGTSNPFRAIVYVNKVQDAEKLFNVWQKTSTGLKRGSHSYVIDRGHEDKSKTELSSREDNNKIDEFDLKQFAVKWHKNICFLRSGVPAAERISTFEGFSNGRYNVMITTGIAARGIDIPNVNLVVQFDFPLNVTDILHRAGRTGRGGAEGKVISFVTKNNQDLYSLFRAAVDNKKDIAHLFSRKRRLRRRINKGGLLVEERAA